MSKADFSIGSLARTYGFGLVQYALWGGFGLGFVFMFFLPPLAPAILALTCLALKGIVHQSTARRHTPEFLTVRSTRIFPLLASVVATLALLNYTSCAPFGKSMRERALVWEYRGVRTQFEGDQQQVLITAGVTDSAHLVDLANSIEGGRGGATTTVTGFRWTQLGAGFVSLVFTEGATSTCEAYGCEVPIYFDRHCASFAVSNWQEGAIYRITGDQGQESAFVEFQITRTGGYDLKLDKVGGGTWSTKSTTIEKWLSLEKVIERCGAGELRQELRRVLGTEAGRLLDQVYVARRTLPRSSNSSETPVLDLVVPAHVPREPPWPQLAAMNFDGVLQPGGIGADVGFHGETTINLQRYEESLSLSLTTKTGLSELVAEFSNPERFPYASELARANGHNLLIASASPSKVAQLGGGTGGEAITPQYIFDTGRRDVLEIQTARVDIDAGGLYLAQTQGATKDEELIPFGRGLMPFSGPVSPIFSLRDPVSELSPSAWIAVIGFLVGGCFIFASPYRAGSRAHTLRSFFALEGMRGSNGYFNAGVSVWICMVGLLLTRSVMSLRASVSPPETTSSLDEFLEAWGQSAWASFFLAIAGAAIVALLVRPRQGRLTLPSRWAIWLERRTLAWIFAVIALLVCWLNAAEVLRAFSEPQIVLGAVLCLLISMLFAGWPMSAQEKQSNESNHIEGFWKHVDFTRAGIAVTFAWALFDKLLRHSTQEGYFYILNWGLTALAFSLALIHCLKLKKGRWEAVTRLRTSDLIWIALLIWFIDFGSLLYLFPIAASLLVFGFSKVPTSHGSFIHRCLPLFLPLFLLLFLALPFTWTKDVLARGAVNFKLLAQDTVVPRLIVDSNSVSNEFWAGSTGSRDDIQAEALAAKVIEAEQQRWQMLSYFKAPHIGYLEAPLNAGGISIEGILLTDAAYSALLAAEHGKIAAWLVAVVGVTAGLALIIAARLAWLSMMQSGSERDRFRATGLYAVGSLIAFCSTYVALSNLWVVPFVGQNFPLLGISSRLDLILFGGVFLVGLVILATAFTSAEEGQDLQSTGRELHLPRTYYSVPILCVYWLVVLAVALMRQSPATIPYSLPKALAAELLSAADRVFEREITESSLAGRATPAAVRMYYKRYLAQSGQPTPFVSSERRGVTVSVERVSLTPVYSSPDELIKWRGHLTFSEPQGLGAHVVAFSELGFLEIGEGGDPYAVRPGSPLDQGGSLVSEAPVYLLRASRNDLALGGFEFSKGGLLYRWNTEPNKPVRIFLDGKRLSSRGTETLKPHSVVRIDELVTENGRERYVNRMNCIYLGKTDRSLTRIASQNGHLVRSFPLGDEFPFARTIAAAYDQASKNGIDKSDHVLSILEGPQKKLQTVLEHWSVSKERPSSRAEYNGDNLIDFASVSIIDPFTGKVFALASVPNQDPNLTLNEATRLFRDRSNKLRSDDTTAAWASNWNLRRGSVGSVVKPWLFAALSEGFRSSGFDVAGLRVLESGGWTGDGFSRVGRWIIDPPVQGDPESQAGVWPEPVSMATFLRASRTYPAVALAFLGLVEKSSELSSVLVSPSQQAPALFMVDGKTKSIDLGRIYPDGAPSPLELPQTVLMASFAKAFDPFVRTTYVSTGDPDFYATYLPEIELNETILAALPASLIPQFHDQNATNMTDLSAIARYAIGGQEQQWSTLVAANNFARLTVGRTIALTFRPDAPPAPISTALTYGDEQWRRRHLLKPLGEITTLVAATGRIDLDDYQTWRGDSEGNTVRPGLRIVMKTGTVDDDAGWESELLTFTIGQYGTSGWVPGQTVTGALNIRAARPSRRAGTVSPQVRGDVFLKILPIIKDLLGKRS